MAAQLRRLVDAGRVSAAFELLHRAYADDVARFVRYEGPSSSFEDVSQEVWAAAYRALPGYRFDASPKAWLFGIASHKAADALRRKRRARLVSLPLPEDGLDRVLDRLVGPQSTPSSHYRRQRRAKALLHAIARLPPLDRKLVELRFFFGLKPSEVVEVLALDQSAHALSQRLLRALGQLRRKLEQDGEFRRG